jgi:putative toxin-antitoxin system antitoxin component (TIGR02293 family)
MKVYQATLDLFEADTQAATHWFTQPAMGLGNQTPISMVTTDVGAQLVIHFIGQLEHGNYA